jgi:hypothetical protein
MPSYSEERSPLTPAAEVKEDTEQNQHGGAETRRRPERSPEYLVAPRFARLDCRISQIHKQVGSQHCLCI